MAESPDVRLRVVTHGELRVNQIVDLALVYTAPPEGVKTGGNIWIFNDFRQFPEGARRYLNDGGITVLAADNCLWSRSALNWGGVVRTMELVPDVPEFINAIHLRCIEGNLSGGSSIRILLKTVPNGYRLPQNAIEGFYFWAVEDPAGEMRFEQSDADAAKYYYFNPQTAPIRLLRSNPLRVSASEPVALRVSCPPLSKGPTVARFHAEDEFGNPVDIPREFKLASTDSDRTVRAMPGSKSEEVALKGPVASVVGKSGRLSGKSNPVLVGSADRPLNLYWGELHGMVFNQRPYREHFEWARDVAYLDFAAGELFSYLACVDETWQEFIKVWDEFNKPGEFVTLPAVEYGTPPDGSHRIGFFTETRGLPPLLCEHREGAKAPRLTAKFSTDTIYCADYRALYREVHERGGIVHGHYHTRFYEQETLAEIYQKQQFDVADEEEKINRYLRAGVRLGIVGGSDTHDSRPTNPFPEPGPGRPSGITGVWAKQLDRKSILEALRKHRCYATTGARMIVDLQVSGQPMGSAISGGDLDIWMEAVGTEPIATVEIIENGQVARTIKTAGAHLRLKERHSSARFPDDKDHYLYLRITQVDGNRAWTSPVWIEG